MRLLLPAAAVVLLAGCGGEALTAEQLRDPTACQGCHPEHYREWARSMHAYAADDPVFRAMNRRGQRDTGGQLGDFCVKCHAPMAVRSGATQDGLNLDALPAAMRGVTCYFCHTIEAVEGTHDAAVRLAIDDVLRGGISDPLETPAHAAAYSPLLDREQLGSADLCGACHDIVNPAGAPLERTFQEWKRSIFATQASIALTCSKCHMEGRDAAAADVEGAPLRKVHGHAFPAVDVALTPFNDTALARREVERALDQPVQAQLCVQLRPANIIILLDNVGAGHEWPSGATQDRRAWVEVVAYKDGAVLYQSGVVPEGTPPESLADPDLWLLRECMRDGAGREVSMFWEASAVDGNALPPPVTLDPNDPRYFITHVSRGFPGNESLPATPDRVTMRVRLQPVGLAVLDDLVASGDLDPAVRAAMPTFDLAPTVLEWTVATSTAVLSDVGPLRCVSNAPMPFVITGTIGRSLARCR